jgi:diguanylate cyclase (GGDEF)-like protein
MKVQARHEGHLLQSADGAEGVMQIDASTLLLVTCLITTILSAAQLIVWWNNREIVSMAYWSASMFLVLFIFLLFIPLQTRPDEMIWPLFSNILVCATYMLIWGGVRVFAFKKPFPTSTVVGVMLYMSVILLMLYLQASIYARILVQAPMVVLFSTMACYDLFTLPKQHRDAATTTVACLLLIHALFFAGRVIVAAQIVFLGDTWGKEYLFGWTYLHSSMFLVSISIGFLVMTTTRLQTELRRKATTDALTGVPNRRWFIEHAEMEFRRTRRNGSTFCVVVIDIDHFKSINDTHGHNGGDKVLKTLARQLAEGLRSTDLFCRWGGEEFCALLPDTKSSGARSVLDRLRNEIAHLAIEHDGHPIKVTISVGVAESREDSTSLDQIVARADEALYQAKSMGRNRVVIEKASGAQAALS